MLAWIAAPTLIAASAAAQCDPQWLPGDPVATPTGSAVQSLSWDPDGAGPAAPLLVVAGRVTAGSVVDVGVAAWDGSQWLSLGVPPAGEVTAIANFQGALVAAFRTDYTVTTLAAWNGTAWQTLGTFSGSPAYVNALTIFLGSLYVGGDFTSVNGIPATRVASWNGTSWSAAGGGQPRVVYAMVPFSNAIYVASYDTLAQVGYLATWTGTAWTNLASCNGPIQALTVRNTTTLATSFLFASGSFTQWTGSNGTIAAARVVRFSPTANAWTALGSNLTGNCCSIYARPIGQTNYELVTVQRFNNEGLWSWNGTTWVQQGGTVVNPMHVSYHASAYHVASAAGSFAVPVQRLQAGVWTTLTQASTALGPIQTVLDAGAQAVVGGAFGIRQGNPGAWNAIGGGLTGDVSTLARLANGDLVVGGTFAIPGGVAASRIARWNGTAWSSLTTTMNGLPRSLLALPDGGFVAGGEFTSIDGVVLPYIARWSGTAWQPVGGGMNARVTAVVRLPTGDIVAGGDFTLAGSLVGNVLYLARWNGSAWSQFGLGVNGPVAALAVQPDGQLVVATTVGYWQAGEYYWAVRGSGGPWSVLPIAPAAKAVIAQPDGDLLFGTVNGLLRLTGSTVTSYGGGSVSVSAVVAAANGDVLVGGTFVGLSPVASVNFARLASTCPATSVTAGAGCTGSAGPLTLAATALPWTGSTFRAVANGLPAVGLGVVVTGFTPTSLPLIAVLSTALPGCTLHVTPDLLEIAVPVGGSVTAQLAIPNSLPLVGLVLHHQVVGLKLGAASAITEVTSTNSLRSTVGAL